MLETICAVRCASTLRSSSASPSPLPTPWPATMIAATTKPIAARAARAAGVAQRRSQASASSLLGFTRSASLVEVELGQHALDHLGGHPLRDLEVAGAHGDVVEG